MFLFLSLSIRDYLNLYIAPFGPVLFSVSLCLNFVLSFYFWTTLVFFSSIFAAFALIFIAFWSRRLHRLLSMFLPFYLFPHFWFHRCAIAHRDIIEYQNQYKYCFFSVSRHIYIYMFMSRAWDVFQYITRVYTSERNRRVPAWPVSRFRSRV